MMIYNFLNIVIELSTKIDLHVNSNQLPAKIFIASDKAIVQEFLNFKDKGTENNGYDEHKNRMVVKSLLFIEKKLELVNIPTLALSNSRYSETVRKR